MSLRLRPRGQAESDYTASGVPVSIGPAVRGAIVQALVGVIVVVTAVQAIAGGLHTQLPGPMSRHRDAMAVAISFARYGMWDGYASLKLVNRTLLENGLSVQADDVHRVGATGYFEVMQDPQLLGRAFQAALSLNDPASDGLFFMQDEKGMALMFIAAFWIFGMTIESLFYFYMLLICISLVITCVTFRHRNEVLFVFLAFACIHGYITLLLPELPKLDVNLIQGNRYLAILGLVPVFHIVFLMLYAERPTPWLCAGMIVQVLLIALLINARFANASQALACFVFATVLLARRQLRSARHGQDHASRRESFWPVGVLGIGMLLLWVHQSTGFNSAFYGPTAQQGRVFWHNLMTAVANSPERGDRYGIPANMPAYDDQVGYLIFDQEIARRGEARAAYLIGDADWRYRTSDPSLDFRWNAYDLVLRGVFVRTLQQAPLYVVQSLLVLQPIALAKTIFAQAFFQWRYLLSPPFILALFVGWLAALPALARSGSPMLGAVAVVGVCALLPVLSAAVVELRVIEVFFLVLLSGTVGLAIAFAVGFRSLVGARSSGHPDVIGG